MPRLFPVEPRALGTADVEGLSSYITRLATDHAISTTKLMEFVSAMGAETGASCPLGARTVQIPNLVRPNQTTEQLVNLLSVAAGLDRELLESTTFLALTASLDRGMGEFSADFRWCPGCMAESIAAGTPGYFKLQWHLRDIGHCATHRLLLVDRCPHCGNHQRSTYRSRDCAYCVVCSGALGIISERPTRIASWDHDSSDLLSLVAQISAAPGLRFPEQGVRKALRHLFEEAWDAEEEERFWAMIPRDECLAYTTEDCSRPMTLQSARRISYRLDMPLVDMLAGLTKGPTRTFDTGWNRDLPAPLRPNPRRRFPNRKLLLVRLQEFLQSDQTPPPSLRAVARALGVSVGGMRYHFPDQSQRIVEQYQAWRLAERQRKNLSARAAALSYWVEQLRTPSDSAYSRKRALRELRASTGLPKELLRREISRVFDMGNT